DDSRELRCRGLPRRTTDRDPYPHPPRRHAARRARAVHRGRRHEHAPHPDRRHRTQSAERDGRRARAPPPAGRIPLGDARRLRHRVGRRGAGDDCRPPIPPPLRITATRARRSRRHRDRGRPRSRPQPLKGPTMPHTRVLDSTIHHRETGTGAPIVFLHGNPTSSYLWRDVLPGIGPGRLLAPDLIGMGESGKPAIDYSFGEHARYLDAWFDALGLDRVVLVGHDWGGALAFDWAARHPGRVRGIAFTETGV